MKLQLFIAATRHELKRIDVSGLLSRATTEHQPVRVLPNRFPKLTGAMFKSQSQLDKNSHNFLEQFGHSIWATFIFIKRYSPQFMRKFFTTLTPFLEGKGITTTAPHTRTNEQLERYNVSIVA